MASGPSRGLGMPVIHSGPRVTSTQLLATTEATSASPSVPTANACSARRNNGTPTSAATVAAARTAPSTAATKGQPTRVARMAAVYAPMPQNAGWASDRLPTWPTTRSYDNASAPKGAARMRTCRTSRSCGGATAAISQGALTMTRPTASALPRRMSDPDPAAEQPLRPPQQHGDHDQEGDGVL